MEGNICGIYCILNQVNGHMYIGSSKCIRSRWYMHRNDLRKNRHHSQYLQYAWNKYLEENFQLIILELSKESELTSREQFWFDNAYPEYNMSSIAGRIEFTDYIKEKVRQAQLRLCENPAEREYRSNRAKEQWATPGIMEGVIDKFHAGAARVREERIAAGLPLDRRTPEGIETFISKMTGQTRSEASCKQMSESHTGVPWTEAQREARKRSNTPERLKAQSIALKKFYDSLTPEEKKLRSLKQAAKRYGKPLEYYLNKEGVA